MAKLSIGKIYFVSHVCYVMYIKSRLVIQGTNTYIPRMTYDSFKTQSYNSLLNLCSFSLRHDVRIEYRKRKYKLPEIAVKINKIRTIRVDVQIVDLLIPNRNLQY